MYVLPPVLAAAFLAYSPIIIKTLNILIAYLCALIFMAFWSFLSTGFVTQSTSFILHTIFYAFVSLFFISLIYVLETKK